jgi:hypothetical protein
MGKEGFTMSAWDGASRWVNTVLLAVVGLIGFDTLFSLLGANDQNVIVAFAGVAGTVLLAPFVGMFEDQDYLLTSLIAILGYALLAGIVLAFLRSVQASRRRPARQTVPPQNVLADAGWSRGPNGTGLAAPSQQAPEPAETPRIGWGARTGEPTVQRPFDRTVADPGTIVSPEEPSGSAAAGPWSNGSREHGRTAGG